MHICTAPRVSSKKRSSIYLTGSWELTPPHVWGGVKLQMAKQKNLFFKFSSSLWFQTIWKILYSQNWIISPIFGVKKNRFELPPPDLVISETPKPQLPFWPNHFTIGCMGGIGRYIYIDLPWKLTIHVGKYTVRPMDPVGYRNRFIL